MGKSAYDLVVTYILENQDKFYRLAYSYTKNKDSALDIVQNSICKALEKYRKLRDVNYIKTWFYRILVNESLSYLKKNRKEILTGPENMAEEAYFEPAYEHGMEIYQMISNLPSEIKTVIILHFYEEMTLKEISEITRVNLNTIKSRLYAGIKKLKILIKEV